MKLAIKRWPRVMAIAMMMAGAAFIFAISLGDVLSQIQVLQGGMNLRAAQGVSFSTYYAGQGAPNVDDAAISYVAQEISQQRAYSAVIYNVGVDDPSPQSGLPPIILVGDVVPDLYPDLNLCRPAPCAQIGAKVETTDSEVRVGKRRIPIRGRLNSGATLFDPNATGILLDKRQVIRLDPTTLSGLGPTEREELLTRVVLLDPMPEQIDAMVTTAARNRLNLVPQNLATNQPARFRSIMTASSMYIVGILAFVTLTLMAFISATRITLAQQQREFVIRHWYGASVRHLAARIGAFLATVMLALPLTMMVPLLLIGDGPALGAEWTIVMLLIAYIFIFLWALRSVAHSEKVGSA